MKRYLRIYQAEKKALSRGSTMVEMLVVITIFSIIAVSISTAFISGLKLWNRAKSVDASRYEFLLGMETVARDFRQMVEVKALGCEGTAQKISFPMINKNHVVRVTYTFDATGKALLRKETDLKEVIEEKIEEGGAEKRLLYCEGLELSYLYRDEESKDYVWGSKWEKAQGVFCAVKIDAKFKGEEFVKTIFVPVAQFR